MIYVVTLYLKSLNSIERISSETFIRMFSKEKQNLKDLAAHLGYQSKELNYLLSLLPDYVHKVPNSDDSNFNETEEEVINSSFFLILNYFLDRRFQ